jgi:hypothetical protein
MHVFIAYTACGCILACGCIHEYLFYFQKNKKINKCNIIYFIFKNSCVYMNIVLCVYNAAFLLCTQGLGFRFYGLGFRVKG